LDAVLRGVGDIDHLAVAAFYLGSFNKRVSGDAFAGALFTSYALHVLMKCFIAMRAVRRLSEDRLSGALELLLVTPLQPRDILSGQRRALRRSFRASITWLALLNIALIFVIHGSASLDVGSSGRRMFTGIFLGGILALFADSLALSWIGMDMGLRGKRQQRAVLATLGRVLLPNWLGAFLLVFVGLSGARISETGWAHLITSWFILGFGIDLVLGLRTQWRLHRHFREIASGSLSKEVRTARADSTARFSFGHRALDSAKP